MNTGEPGPIEILQRKADRTLEGPDHLMIYHICPACGNPKAEWIRQQWAVCYICELAFDAFEKYMDLTEEIEE